MPKSCPGRQSSCEGQLPEGSSRNPCGAVSACRARDYSAPVNFISAGLKKGAAEEAELEDSDDEEKPVKQDDFPKDFGPKKLKTVAPLLQDCDLSDILARSLGPKHLLGLSWRQVVWVSPVVAQVCNAVSFLS